MLIPIHLVYKLNIIYKAFPSFTGNHFLGLGLVIETLSILSAVLKFDKRLWLGLNINSIAQESDLI